MNQLRLPSPLPSPDVPTAVRALSEVLQHDPDWLRRANLAYWSWDELRRRPAPVGLSAEEAWGAVAIFRRGRSLDLPFEDSSGRTFRWWIPEGLLESLIEVEGAGADPLDLAQGGESRAQEAEYQLRSMIHEAADSSILEGAATTRREARNLLRSGRRPRSRSERMIVNNFRTIQRLQELAHQPLSLDLILEIHRSITEGTLDDPEDEGRLQTPGETRVWLEDEEGQVLHRPPPASQLRERIERLCRFANADTPFVPPAVRAMLLHFQLAYDHPFADGNGRTARALFYWSMLRRGHWLVRYLSISSVILDSRVQYGRAYLNVERTTDTTYFLLYHLKVYRRALDALGDYIRQRRSDTQRASEALASWSGLNYRQRLLVKRLLDQPDTILTARPVSSEFGVTFQTAMTDLDSLVARGLLQLDRHGRRKSFRAAPQLSVIVETGEDPRQEHLFES